jgi:excisionase family DNA binding protein
VSRRVSPFQTVDETADQFGVGRKTLYAMIRRGEFPPARSFGRKILVSKDALADWLRLGGGRPAVES